MGRSEWGINNEYDMVKAIENLGADFTTILSSQLELKSMQLYRRDIWEHDQIMIRKRDRIFKMREFLKKLFPFK